MESSEEKRRADIWYVTSYIDEYFRLLGGSGCYKGYCDCHVPALFTLAMDEWVGNLPIGYEHAVRYLISNRMWEQTDGLPAKTLDRVGKYQPTPEDIDWFTARVTERYPMKYSPNEEEQWQLFLEGRGQMLNEQS
jgi:hypothetical protein